MSELRAKLTSKEVDIDPVTEQDIHQDVAFAGRGEVISKTDRGDHKVMTVSPQEIYVTKNKGVKPLPDTTSGGSVKRTSEAQKLRFSIQRRWSDHYSQKHEFDAFYISTMQKIRQTYDSKTESMRQY